MQKLNLQKEILIIYQKINNLKNNQNHNTHVFKFIKEFL